MATEFYLQAYSETRHAASRHLPLHNFILLADANTLFLLTVQFVTPSSNSNFARTHSLLNPP